MKNVIFLIGAGNMGSAHFKNILKSKHYLDIFVIDKSNISLQKIKKIIRNKVLPKNFSINFSNKIIKVDQKIKCAIIATNSDVRKKVICDLIEINSVENLIIEKIPFNSLKDYEVILKLINNSKINCYINYPRRLLENYILLKKDIIKKKYVKLKVCGYKWGLASNIFHFLDLFFFLTGNNKLFLKNNFLNKIYKSKRKNFYEINGGLEFISKEKNVLECIDDKIYKNPFILIETNDMMYFIDEINNKLIKYIYSNNEIQKMNLKISYKGLASLYLDKIILNKSLALSTFHKSINNEKLLIKIFTKHFKTSSFKIDGCPIT